VAPPGYLVLGRIVKAFGVLGEVKVAAFVERWDPFRELIRVWIGPKDGPLRSFGLEAWREGRSGVILKLSGVDSPEAAARLVGHEVSLPRREAPDPPEGAYYHYDILGLEVMDGERALGTVCEILETGAHDVYVIQGPVGEWLLPATRAHIRRIDLATRRIQIEPMAGLVSPLSEHEERPDTL
jgi:16S rRNA processing protein RimM